MVGVVEISEIIIKLVSPTKDNENKCRASVNSASCQQSDTLGRHLHITPGKQAEIGESCLSKPYKAPVKNCFLFERERMLRISCSPNLNSSNFSSTQTNAHDGITCHNSIF